MKTEASKFIEAPETLVRYCPGCGSIGDVEGDYRDCCPDGNEARMIPEPLAEKCRDTFKIAIRGMLAEQAAADTYPSVPTETRRVFSIDLKNAHTLADFVNTSEPGNSPIDALHKCIDRLADYATVAKEQA